MKKISVFILMLISCAKNEELEQSGAILFEPLNISSAAPEFAFTINSDNNLLFFNRTSDDRTQMKILTSSLNNDKWSIATELSFSDGRYRDVDPFLSYDGNRLYFSSTRPLIEGSEEKDFDTWYVEKTSAGWSEPINPGSPLNSDSTEIFFTQSKNGNAYFVSEFDGQRGIVVSRFIDGNYLPMERIELKLNGSAIYASNPCISSDEKFLIVSARVGKNPPDLFISFNKNGIWSELQNLGSINSEYADFAPALSRDDQYLYFTSERPGILPKLAEGIRPPGDIYIIELNSIMDNLIKN